MSPRTPDIKKQKGLTKPMLMAPIAPKKLAATRANSSRQPIASSPSNHVSPFADPDAFRTTKRDKRQIKHSIFLSKIEKPRSKTLKRRRPSKKLIANLDSLVDALPDAGDGDDNGTYNHHHNNGPANNKRQMLDSQVNIIRQKTLKHKPGAMKRKEKLDRRERERFARNLAQMAVPPTTSGTNTNANTAVDAQTQVQTQAETQPSTSNRWAALRNFISQTIDQNPEFQRSRPT
ncbi:hypothetical protein ACO22_04457 [Paracoccidioides brasiliensis]|nr:hypothetical protein ACO22_04457 [Paracoccidioides brasiliensis]